MNRNLRDGRTCAAFKLQFLPGKCLFNVLHRDFIIISQHLKAFQRAKERHRRIEHVPKLDHFAGLNQLRRAQHGFWLPAIAGTSLIPCNPFRKAAISLGRWLPGLSLDFDACKKKSASENTVQD